MVIKRTCTKFAIRMTRVSSRLLQLVNAPGIVLDIFVIFRIDGIHFTTCGTLSEQGSQEKLTESKISKNCARD